MLVGKDVQQPRERLSWDVSFREWMPAGDEIATADVTVRRLAGDGADPLVVHDVRTSPTMVQVWLEAGTAGDKWRVEILAETVEGRKREAEFDITVKEV